MHTPLRSREYRVHVLKTLAEGMHPEVLSMHACMLLVPPFPLPRSASGHMSVFPLVFLAMFAMPQQADVQ